MYIYNHRYYLIPKGLLSQLVLSLMLGLSANTCHAVIAQAPLFLTTNATPIVMLNISKDHQLYFKAFDDYSDLDKNGGPETTYKHSIDYYGYFDSYKCYSYTSNRFEPSSTTSTKYCSGLWSGNFLNWASMTRIDTIRKILYGGLRSTDASSTATTTSTTTPVTTNPVITNTVTSAYVASSPNTSDSSNSVDSTLSGPNCSLPATTTTTSAESAPSASKVGTATNSTPVVGSSTNSTPVTNTSGSTTTTTFNTTFDSTYNTTQPTTYTTKYTKVVVSTAFRDDDNLNDCNNTGETAKTKKTTKTTTYTTTYTSTKTDAKKITTTSTTTATTVPATVLTVLERSYLPNDAHSFAKFYNGSDLTQLTPFTSTDVASGITLCNTTVSTTLLSQNVSDAPLIRVAKGNYSLWAANERWQCRWSEEKSAANSNSSANSGISAASDNPVKATMGLGSKDYIARIKVCDSSHLGTENCKAYPDGTKKPIGLLQTYGDDDLIRFGMLTGSYGKNKQGGVLRKNVSSITDEINVTTDGTFKSAPSTGGIINTLNLLRIHGYRNDDGTYFGTTGSDNCTWGLNTFTDGDCSNWGNPQSEIFLESLRYLSNHSAGFLPASPDSSYISGLTVATTNNQPIIATEWCAKLNVIQFNASTSSYDGDQLGNVTDISATAMNTLTNAVGIGESIPGNSYFVGENGTDNNQLCTAKTVSNLSNVKGTCPDAPRLSGTYHIAGLAHFAHNNDITGALQGAQLVTTYGVALSPAIPKIVASVPSTTKTVTILPACRDSSVGGNCAIVDFKIVHQDCSPLSLSSSSYNCGKVYVNWEDSEQGGDFDQDQWGVLTYSVSSTEVKITTDVIAQSTPYAMGFGYILSGTSKDGFHAHSGINSYNYTDPQGTTACSGCTTGNAASTVTYAIGSSSAASLQQPLFYAAKWGGFNDNIDKSGTPDQLNEWDNNNDGIPDRYFFATDPSELAKSLNAAFDDVIKTSSSASAVAANSTRLDLDTKVYQAKFNSSDWSGQLVASSVDTVTGGLTSTWTSEASWPLLPAHGSRNIYTFNPSAAAGSHGVNFQWANLTKDTDSPTPLPHSQQYYLNNGDTNGSLRVNWLRGDNSQEQITNAAGIFRHRTNILGDIVNSDPVYVGNDDFGYSTPITKAGSSTYNAFIATSRTPMIYVGANDGMLHGLNANTTTGEYEIFAYIPNVLFPELSKLTSPSYSHQYFVDGMSATGDVFDGTTWHTILAGTTGAGARAVFALDVTNPDAFGPASALWEFTSADTSYGADLGFTLAQPSVVRMQDDHWAVIVANGYNSDNGHAVLFVLDAQTGAVLQKIDTGVGSTSDKNGLSSPIPIDTDNDRSVDTVYAGDLYGNLWKFNVSGSAGSWPVPSSPFFIACTSSGTTCSPTNRQAITAKPNVGDVGAGADQNGVGRMVYFGTGKYFESGDNNFDTNPLVHTFYGLWDKGSPINDRGLLQEQTIDYDAIATTVGGASSTKPIRVVSNNTVCYAASSVGCTSSSPLKSGWALNLLKPIHIAQGERVISFPLVRRNLVVFSTVIPDPDPCLSGGSSRLMELGALSGGEFGGAPFDVNGDGKVNDSDFVMIAGVKHAAAGIDLGIGITKKPAVVESTTVDFKYLSGSSGAMGTVTDAGGGGGGGSPSPSIRRSWRQLK